LKEKKKVLQEIYDFEKFRENVNDSLNWIENKKQEVQKDEPIKDLEDALALLKKVDEIKDEINSYEEILKKTRHDGNQLISQNHPQSDAVQSLLDQLNQERDKLLEAVDAKKKKLEDEIKLMSFNKNAQEVEDWLDETENAIASIEDPKSIEEIEDLKKKVESLQVEIKLEGEKVKDLGNEAQKLVADDHFAKDQINQRSEAILDRYNKLNLQIAQKKNNLDNAERLLAWNRDADEMSDWLKEKEAELKHNQNSSNVQEKVRKQEELKLEIAAQKKKFDELLSEGRELEKIVEDPQPIEKKIQELEDQWNSLQAETDLFASHLKDAEALKDTERDFDDLDRWFREVEAALSSEDYGSDLPSVQILLKKQTLLEADISSHDPLIQKTLKQAQHLIDSQVFFFFFFSSNIDYLLN